MQPRDAQGPIQNGYTGLLSLLGIKGISSTPNSILGAIQGSLDVGLFLANRPRVSNFGTLALAGDAFTTFLPVNTDTPPVGETWLVLAASAYVFLDPSNSLRQLGICKSNQFALGSDVPITELTDYFSGPQLAPGAFGYAVANCNRPFFLNAGERMGASLSFVRGVNDGSLRVRFEYIPLSV